MYPSLSFNIYSCPILSPQMSFEWVPVLSPQHQQGPWPHLGLAPRAQKEVTFLGPSCMEGCLSQIDSKEKCRGWAFLDTPLSASNVFHPHHGWAAEAVPRDGPRPVAQPDG